MWPVFYTEHPIEQTGVNDGDMKMATLAFGWTIGFGYFVTWHVVQLTKRQKRNAFIIMCWLQILACATFAIICWLYLCGIIKHSFWFYFVILTTWALQVQFYLQILVNRICALLHIPRQRFWLKFIIAAWITTINISVYCIWIPARLQISQRYHDINVWWDRIEKVLYFLTDIILNFMFARLIRKRLGAAGTKQCAKLVRFNEITMLVSLGMDGLIIGMMSYRNDFEFMQFHPLAFMIKLEIELSMSKLMIQMADINDITLYGGGVSLPSSRRRNSITRSTGRYAQSGHTVNARTTRQSMGRTDLDGNYVRDADPVRRDPRRHSRVSAIAWEQSNRSEPIEIVHELGANTKDDDEHSIASSKRPHSWMEETFPPDSNKHRSRSPVSVEDPDIDLEEEKPHSGLGAQATGGATAS